MAVDGEEGPNPAPPSPPPTVQLPPYPEMILEAIDALDNENGSNKTAISGYIKRKYGSSLPPVHVSILTAHLARMRITGELYFAGNNYFVPDNDDDEVVENNYFLPDNDDDEVVDPSEPATADPSSPRGQDPDPEDSVSRSPIVFLIQLPSSMLMPRSCLLQLTSSPMSCLLQHPPLLLMPVQFLSREGAGVDVPAR